jgi:uncharacterized protein YkwD
MLAVPLRVRLPAAAVLIAGALIAALWQPGTAQAVTCSGNLPFERPERREGESVPYYLYRQRKALERNEAAIVCVTNEKRAGHDTNPGTPGVQGLPALVFNRTLQRTARDYSEDMVARGYFDPVNHSTPEGHDLRYRLTDRSYCPGCAFFAENILCKAGQPTPAQIVDAWMNSEVHRRNILSANFREIGVGSAFGTPTGSTGCKGNPGGTFTQDFGTPQ